MNSRKMGTIAEKLFVDLMRARGHAVEKSLSGDDMFGHWDYLIDGKFRVDVKARKKAKRSDQVVNDQWVYVEFKNVRGDAGWLYGQADYIALERPDGFLLVPRTQLKTIAETLVKTDWASQPTPYKSYRRQDRPLEHVGVLMITDVLQLTHKLVRYGDG